MMQHNLAYKGQPPQDGALAWECTEYLADKTGNHAQSLPHLLRVLKDMQKSLDKTRAAYNQALQDRDDERAKLQEAENRLGSVQRVVQRYAGVQEPVVASDGYTYERSVIQQYLNECKSTETNAYSQQTKEVLSTNLVPNESLKKLVDLLRQVRPTDIAPASKATTIPPYRATAAGNVNFLEEEEKGKKTIHAADLEAGLKSDAPSAPAGAKRDEIRKFDREDKPVAHHNIHRDANASAAQASAAPNAKGGKQALHPCLRVYGFCNFKDDCSFAKYPYDACLNYIKGKCRFGDGCKELHVNLKENKYTNAHARHHNNDHHGAGGAAGHKRFTDEKREEKKENTSTNANAAAVAKPAAKESTKVAKK